MQELKTPEVHPTEAVCFWNAVVCMQFYVQERKLNELEAIPLGAFFSLDFVVMGSSVEATQAVATEAGTPAVAVGTPAVVLGTPSLEGTMPAEVHQPDASGDQPKPSEMASPMTPKVDEVTEEDAEAIRAAKRARLDEAETEEVLDDRAAVLKCLHHVQAALEYTARQQKSIQELQAQIQEIGAVAYHGESAQKYSLAVVNAAANNLRNGVWQLTGSKSEEKTTIKTMLQMLVTSAGKSQSALTKIAEAIQNQTQQSKEQHQHFTEVLLQIQGQIADSFSAMRGTAAPAAPTSAAMPVFPPAAPITPTVGATMAETPVAGYGTPMQATVPASMPAPPAPPMPPVNPPQSRATVTLSLRQNDGSIQTRLASPTPYRDERLRGNPSYVYCDDRAYRRLL
eukprot:s1622_g24.t1